MANAQYSSRSNYFKVKDADAFKKEITQLFNPEEVEVWNGKDGTVAFGGYIDITEYYCPEKEETVSITPVIQKHLAKGEACLIPLIGMEKLRYLVTGCMIITEDDDKWIDAQNEAEREARAMLFDDGKEFVMTY